MKYKVLLSVVAATTIMFSGCGGITPQIEKAGVSEADYDKWAKKIDLDNKNKRNKIITGWNQIGVTDYVTFEKWISLSVNGHNSTYEHYQVQNYQRSLIKLDINFDTLEEILKISGGSERRTIEWFNFAKTVDNIKAWKSLTGNYYKAEKCKNYYNFTLKEAQDWKYKVGKNCKDARRVIDREEITLEDAIKIAKYKFDNKYDKQFFSLFLKNNPNKLSEDLISKYVKFFSKELGQRFRGKRAYNVVISYLNSIYDKSPKIKYTNIIDMYSTYNRTIRVSRNDYMRTTGDEYKIYKQYFKNIKQIDLGNTLFKTYVDKARYKIMGNDSYKEILKNTAAAINAGYDKKFINQKLIPLKISTVKQEKELMNKFGVTTFAELEDKILPHIKGYKKFIEDWTNSGIKYPASWLDYGIDLEAAKTYTKMGITGYMRAEEHQEAGIKTEASIKSWTNLKGYKGHKSQIPSIKKAFGKNSKLTDKEQIAVVEEWISYGFSKEKGVIGAIKGPIDLSTYRKWYKVDTGLDINELSNLIDLGRTPASFKKAKSQCNKKYVTSQQLTFYPDEIKEGTCLTGLFLIYDRPNLNTVRLFVNGRANTLLEMDVSGIDSKYTRKGKMIYLFTEIDKIGMLADEYSDDIQKIKYEGIYLLKLKDLLNK